MISLRSFLEVLRTPSIMHHAACISTLYLHIYIFNYISIYIKILIDIYIYNYISNYIFIQIKLYQYYLKLYNILLYLPNKYNIKNIVPILFFTTFLWSFVGKFFLQFPLSYLCDTSLDIPIFL